MTKLAGRERRELGLRWGRIDLGPSELDQGAVDLGEEQESAQGTTLAQTGPTHGRLSGCHPGEPLGLQKSAPAGGHGTEGRTDPICDGVRGLAGMASARLIWPNWPACETFRPRLPDCECLISSYYNFLSFVVLV